MDDSTIEEALRTRLYNFYCELGWDCYTAEALAENITVPEDVLESYWLDMLSAQGDADHDSYMGK